VYKVCLSIYFNPWSSHPGHPEHSFPQNIMLIIHAAIYGGFIFDYREYTFRLELISETHTKLLSILTKY